MSATARGGKAHLPGPQAEPAPLPARENKDCYHKRHLATRSRSTLPRSSNGVAPSPVVAGQCRCPSPHDAAGGRDPDLPKALQPKETHAYSNGWGGSIHPIRQRRRTRRFVSQKRLRRLRE